MINVANLTTNNPALILAAFAFNALAWLASTLIAIIEWLVPALLAGGAAVVRTVASHWRVVAMLAGLVAAVVLVALFWQVIVIGAGVLGGMYAGLLVVVRI